MCAELLGLPYEGILNFEGTAYIFYDLKEKTAVRLWDIVIANIREMVDKSYEVLKIPENWTKYESYLEECSAKPEENTLNILDDIIEEAYLGGREGVFNEIFKHNRKRPAAAARWLSGKILFVLSDQAIFSKYFSFRSHLKKAVCMQLLTDLRSDLLYREGDERSNNWKKSFNGIESLTWSQVDLHEFESGFLQRTLVKMDTMEAYIYLTIIKKAISIDRYCPEILVSDFKKEEIMELINSTVL